VYALGFTVPARRRTHRWTRLERRARPMGCRDPRSLHEKPVLPLRLRYDTGSVERICSART
jgi:hypothetical protein